MTHSEHRVRFTYYIAKLILFAHETLNLFIAVDETGRTLDQQKLYVEQGVSWTLNSDHLLDLAVDWVFYRLTDNGLYPIWSASNPILIELMQYWVKLDPLYHYCGYFEWGKDTPHFGRKRRPGQNLKSRLAVGITDGLHA